MLNEIVYVQNVILVMGCVWSIGFWILMMFLSALGSALIRHRYSSTPIPSKSSQLSPKQAPPVTILRPLKGVDVNLFENLASSFTQDYPVFEIIFLVASKNDPAIEIVKELMKMYPKVDASLLIGQVEHTGVNPKVNNLMRGYERAKYDIMWVVDSNVWVNNGCLGRSIDELSKPNVGLIHHLPCGLRPHSLGSRLELAFLNSAHAKMYVAINFLSIAPCIVGKSNIFRKSDLNRAGGLKIFGCYMSEDNVIGTALWNLGLKHRMTRDMAYQSLGTHGVSDYFNRRARWIRIRKYAVSEATAVEPFTESIVCGLMAAYSFTRLFPEWFPNPVLFFIVHMIIWICFDFSIMYNMNRDEVFSLKYWAAWLLRELCALHLYIYAVAGSCVEWRGNLFRLLPDGTVEEIVSINKTDPLRKFESSEELVEIKNIPNESKKRKPPPMSSMSSSDSNYGKEKHVDGTFFDNGMTQCSKFNDTTAQEKIEKVSSFNVSSPKNGSTAFHSSSTIQQQSPRLINIDPSPPKRRISMSSLNSKPSSSPNRNSPLPSPKRRVSTKLFEKKNGVDDAEKLDDDDALAILGRMTVAG